jgi:hypothetical protein
MPPRFKQVRYCAQIGSYRSPKPHDAHTKPPITEAMIPRRWHPLSFMSLSSSSQRSMVVEIVSCARLDANRLRTMVRNQAKHVLVGQGFARVKKSMLP